MVLFHETRPQRGSTSDNAAPAATNKELDVEAMITEIIMEKVLKDPESPDKGEPTRSGTSCMTLRRVGDKLHLNCNFCNFRYISSTSVSVTKILFKSNFSTLLRTFSLNRTHAFFVGGRAEPRRRQETLELGGPGHAQGVLRHEDVAGEPLGHPRAPQEAAHLRLQAAVHSRCRVEPGKR